MNIASSKDIVYQANCLAEGIKRLLTKDIKLNKLYDEYFKLITFTVVEE